MAKTKTKTRLFALLGLTFMFTIGLIIIYIPLVDPEFTIQCVPDVNCIIEKITLYERYVIG